MAKPRTGFEEVFKKISLETQLTALRPAVLRDVFSEANRKRAAAVLNNELAHFEKTFIATFIGSPSATPKLRDASPLTPTGLRGLEKTWLPLSLKWLAVKRQQDLETPNFFHFGGFQPQPKAPDAYQNPEITLETYLKRNWHSQKVLNTFGKVKPEDIIFTNSRGVDVTLKRGKADLDAPFLGKLRTSRKDITNLSETFTIGFRLFPALELDKSRDIFSNHQIEITKKLIPLSENTAANGYPLSKLTNNNEQYNNSGSFRPTVGPLLNWYYRVKLPHVFKQFYKTKGLVGR